APAVAPAAAGQAQGAMLPLLKAKLMGNGKDGHAYYELGKEVGMGVDEKGNVVKGEIKAVGFAANDKRPQATGPDYYFEIQNPTEGDFNAGRFNIGGAVVRSLAESIKGGSVYK
ncbi:MAG: hypothetical protein NTV07_07435, partial [Candidatus Omnitrophica bacterium]|nr:hypothetical protein [Candidatus Omnitrophota bacterium]